MFSGCFAETKLKSSDQEAFSSLGKNSIGFTALCFISLKKYQIHSLSKCSSKEFYSLQVSLNESKTTSQIYFKKLFQNKEIKWTCIYLMPWRVTIDTNLHIFQ